jgi:quinoprotein dehydrogenase-associated probable ABC transporter substrate-binding protein
MSSGSRPRRLGPALSVYSAVPVVVVLGLAAGVARQAQRGDVRAVVHLAAPPVVEPPAAPEDPSLLRVCADPNNLPYSNDRQEGFENAIAQLVAVDLHRTLHYVWQPQRRGFIRTTLRAGACDVVMGIPVPFTMARPTVPYYRSSYVFVTRRNHGHTVRSLDDPSLRRFVIGVQVVGEDYENPPPLQALAARKLANNIRGFTVYGDYADAAPQRPLLDAVARGEVDVAIAWGPLGGYFASRSRVPLAVTPIPAVADLATPFSFDIAMGVRKDNQELADALDATIARHRTEIRRVLERFGVPLVG